ncbi:MAG: DNA recombination protein RmuC [Proteobacteria bacterium]|nr:DNA recombination protein RmuC [Pseudomonadota bacterium]
MMMEDALLWTGMLSVFCLILLSAMIRTHYVLNKHLQKLSQEQAEQKEKLFETLLKAQQSTHEALNHFSQQHFTIMQNSLRENFVELERQIYNILVRTTSNLSQQFDKLRESTENQLLKISDVVEQRLSQGFEKTNATFTNIISRLAMIDDAQKKITALSQNVISLQEILSDKRSRGAFGEVQLNTLLNNCLPSNSYLLQHTLSNNTRVDCLLLLPEPTGKIAIDAKFPLENYKKYTDNERSEQERTLSKQQYKLDIKKHIQDISQKYIIAGETGEGALMFIPAEAIFADIHSNHPDLVEYAMRQRVWLASPSTMMAILTTACAVLKDSATRQQIHVIQKHLRLLAQDFSRFEKRMDNLSRHIQQANDDVSQVQTSAQKITKHFTQIEKVELSFENDTFMPELQTAITKAE